MIERLSRNTGAGPRALIVTPTRELAMQVHQVFRDLDTGLRDALLYGGSGYATQNVALKSGPDVVIGTPGRILDMVGKRLMSLGRLEYVVLDEADEMLDQGFAPDVERILGQTWSPQTVLASATMPAWVERMIEKYLNDPEVFRVEADEESKLEHGILRMRREEKVQVLGRLLDLKGAGSVIAFGRTKDGVARLCRDLQRIGHKALPLQGDMQQSARDRTMAAFRDGRAEVLVATNVAARGLDISRVALVVNYDLPDTAQWLTHRIGRTARNGADGFAITFVTPEDDRLWQRLLREGAPELPEIDRNALLADGGWRYVDQTPAPTTPAPTTPAPPDGPRRRRRGGRGRPRGDRRTAAA
jgi:ATP-dependent RNA helicase DeaD